MRRLLVALATTMVMLAAVSGTAAAGPSSRPFRVTGEGTTTVTGDSAVSVGTARGTQLGIASYTLNATQVVVTATVDMCNGVASVLDVNGSLVFTGANGDTLTGSVDGQSCINQFTDNGESRFIVDITGGTGRFSGATGTLTMQVYSIWVPSGYPSTDEVTLNGVIDYP